MALKVLKPTSNGVRGRIAVVSPELHKGAPERSLTTGLTKSGGRNNNGRVTSFHRGGGHKRLYRTVDFKRDNFGIAGKVARLEYDPNRTAHIALVVYVNGDKRYILAPQGLRPGDVVMSGPDAEIRPGNALPLAKIRVGTLLHNIEMKPGKGGQLARSAGASIQLMGKEGGLAVLKMPSGEFRRVDARCLATIGVMGNADHSNRKVGKAGRSRWLGVRPNVRGVAMNPVDHPHGGGEGRTSGGRHPVTPWGVPTKGHKTRNKNKASTRDIIRRRNQK
ncbi:50S ribosomal protein L2 [Mariprofundus erugo]|uniref:Large ribosomal subunit protein uL2 n=1 Tax=Mariprofundus erugo TaxID=2528639 RepID=A0A5R9GGC3_9PROT|nr:50S ribosomal protein L2 [Mariprofundus erugo]TLS65520.1 50S ribosomal protein L2 [Mariprofundus erugo]TLS74074.1 50S ribosomal protein L2 [Mariprofundus erugo]